MVRKSKLAPPLSDKTPPQPKNCPGDSELRIGACDTTTNFVWDKIAWEDDKSCKLGLNTHTQGAGLSV